MGVAVMAIETIGANMCMVALPPCNLLSEGSDKSFSWAAFSFAAC